MLNQVVLVGRLVKDVEVHEGSSNHQKKVATIRLAIPRSFKNREGLYDTDFIDCVLWDSVAINTANYCKKGDIVGIKGRVESRIITEEETNKTILQIIAEKVTFLSSKKEEENERSK